MYPSRQDSCQTCAGRRHRETPCLTEGRRRFDRVPCDMPDFARSLPFIPEDPRPADLSQYANADVKQGANEAIRLRFQLRDRVECWYGRGKYEGWSPGQIAKCWYREPDWPVGNFAPYQVRLDFDGALIYAPCDTDEFIISERKTSVHTRLESNSAASTSSGPRTPSTALDSSLSNFREVDRKRKTTMKGRHRQ